MQIDLVKYMMSLKTFEKELNDLLNTRIPEGYIEVDARKHKEKKSQHENSRLSRSD